MERDCESELSKLNIEQNACIYHFGASVIHGQRSNILRLLTKNTVFLRCFLLTYFMILQNIGKNSDSVIIPVEKNIIPNTTVIIELTLIFF